MDGVPITGHLFTITENVPEIVVLALSTTVIVAENVFTGVVVSTLRVTYPDPTVDVSTVMPVFELV
jgi:hypothetical protein